MIAIVNYGLGNLQAIANIYKSKNIAVVSASTPEDLQAADHIILPGVGSFDHAMERLSSSGMQGALIEEVKVKQKPVLGICVGMQMMADRSEEGTRLGLGWIGGAVKRFDTTRFTQRTHLPHMGWNNVHPRQATGLFNGLGHEARFYFLHSYYFAPASDAAMLAVTDYDGPYASSVACGNVYGVQFHPEKSHQWGIQLLMNFAAL